MSNALASPEELFQFLNIPNDGGAPRDRAEMLLDIAADEVFGYTRQEFVRGSSTVTLDGSGTKVLLLPQIPVVSVASILEDGESLDSSLWEWSEKGILRRLSGYWTERLGFYEVTYTHGFLEIPKTVKGVVLRIAARAFSNPSSLTQESIGKYTSAYGFDASRTGSLSEADKVVLRDWMAK